MTAPAGFIGCTNRRSATTCSANWVSRHGWRTWRRCGTPTPGWSRSDMATQTPPSAAREGEILAPGHTYHSVTEQISSIVQTQPTSRGWIFGFAVAFLLTMVLLNTIGYLLLKGVGIWGVNQPVGWGFAIVNFVWWIGIGHA